MQKRAKLTNEQIDELQSFMGDKKTTFAEIMRAQAVILINDGAGGELIKKLTRLDQKSAFKIRRKYQDHGLDAIRSPRRKERRLLTKGQIAQVRYMVEHTKPSDHGFGTEFWTTSILAKVIQEKFGVIYKSKTSYHIIFKEVGFTYHKPEKVYASRNQATIDAWKKEKLPIIQAALKDKNMVVLAGDEMILTTQVTTQKVWLLASDYASVQVANKRERRCVYGFFNAKTKRVHAFKTSHINSEMTCRLLRKLAKMYPDEKIMLVWDNAGWHKSKVVKALLEKLPDKFHLVAFPPYAPEENPQEHVWKAGRANVTHNKFIENIDAAANELVSYFNGATFDYEFA